MQVTYEVLRIWMVILAIQLSNLDGICQNTSNKALLVIDVQENLVNPDSKIHIDTTNLETFFKFMNSAIDKFHSSGSLVTYIVNEWSNPIINWGTGNVCKKGGKGVEIDQKLKLVNNHIYFKSKPNALYNKYLIDFLRENKITTVYVIGLMAEGCIKATVEGLLRENYHVIVLEDAIASKNAKCKSKALSYFQNKAVDIMRVRDL